MINFIGIYEYDIGYNRDQLVINVFQIFSSRFMYVSIHGFDSKWFISITP
jgi:hypothetical protein